MTIKMLHFTIGPVQSFVAQSRRTRDLATGSFLLSFLVGHAMAGVLKNGGEMVFPSVKDVDGGINVPMLEAIVDHHAHHKAANGVMVGALPNRFVARVPADFKPENCITAVNVAWHKIADTVYGAYVEPLAGFGNNTKAIWGRQVRGFWDMSWITAPEMNALDMKKNWRTYVPPVEAGDKCTLMSNWQELSGYVRSKERASQDEFWQAFRELMRLYELDEGERLSAIALIKRLLPRVAKEAIGWPLPISYPSTPYLSAVHWMEQVMEETPELAKVFAKEAKTLASVASTTGIYDDFPCLRIKTISDEGLQPFASLDGNCFYQSSLGNTDLWQPVEYSASGENHRQTQSKLSKLLSRLPGEPSPYYAILLMDGDNMGRLLQSHQADDNSPNPISQAITAFSIEVPKVVQTHNSITIYAGGDDVLAFCPLEDALPLSIDLQNKYRQSFVHHCAPDVQRQATISAVIMYVHHRSPLRQALIAVHSILDDVAKRQCGRNSLAMAVWRMGGVGLMWANPWPIVFGGKPKTSEANDILGRMDEVTLARLVKDLIREGQQAGLSSSFIYNIFRQLSDTRLSQFEEAGGGEMVLAKLLKAEYLRAQRATSASVDIDALIDGLMQVSLQYQRRADGGLVKSDDLNLDGVLLARFLATKGVQ